MGEIRRVLLLFSFVLFVFKVFRLQRNTCTDSIGDSFKVSYVQRIHVLILIDVFK